MPANRRLATVVVALAFGPGLAGCWREERAFRPAPSTAEALRWTSLSELHPGLPRLTGPQAEAVAPPGHAANAYEENAYAISEGKRFYAAYNCNGCHAHGGGDIGPPLLDDKWIYGHEPEQVFSTIVEG